MIERLPEVLRPEQYKSLTDVYDYVAREHGERDAYYCLGKTLSYCDIDRLSTRFAAYLQQSGNLQPGDRIAIQLPNLLQFPVVLMGAVKAGLIVVNTNPLYTAKEMAHQFSDSGAKAIVILSAFCDKLQQILPQTEIETVIITELGDLQSPLKRQLLNFAARYLKKAVPNYQLPGSKKLLDCLNNQFEFDEAPGRARGGKDPAVLLYTGGTTGVSKGAMLSHSNLIANMMQLRSRCLLIIDDKTEVIGAPLPLYHSYAFLLHCLAMPYAGNLNLLMPNPRDIDSVVGLFKKFKVSGFVGINTLFLALLRHKEFASLDFSHLKFCGAGGMALSTSVAKEWVELTGCEIFEGYGLTECSPVVSVNIPGDVRYGTVGRLVPETEIKVVNEDGEQYLSVSECDAALSTAFIVITLAILLAASCVIQCLVKRHKRAMKVASENLPRVSKVGLRQFIGKVCYVHCLNGSLCCTVGARTGAKEKGGRGRDGFVLPSSVSFVCVQYDVRHPLPFQLFLL